MLLYRQLIEVKTGDDVKFYSIRWCYCVCVRVNLQQEFECVIVLNPAFTASHGCQVGEPNTGDPVLVVRRVEALEFLPFLSGHESCTTMHTALMKCSTCGWMRVIIHRIRTKGLCWRLLLLSALCVWLNQSGQTVHAENSGTVTAVTSRSGKQGLD